MLRNDQTTALTVAQIAAHLQTKPWNITRELQLGARKEPGRLYGTRSTNGGPGRGRPWSVNRLTYLAWLRIPAEDLEPMDADGEPQLGPDGLPKLYRLDEAARALGLEPGLLKVVIRQGRFPYVFFGRNEYLTHNQLKRMRVQLAKTAGD